MKQSQITTNEHYVQTMQDTGYDLKTHDVYIIHMLDLSQPPAITANTEAVKRFMNYAGECIKVYVNPVHEVNNVVYIGDSFKDYTKTLVPNCTRTGKERRV